jgi:hypothetical protein
MAECVEGRRHQGQYPEVFECHDRGQSGRHGDRHTGERQRDIQQDRTADERGERHDHAAMSCGVIRLEGHGRDTLTGFRLRRFRDDEVHVAESDGAATYQRETGVREQRFDIMRGDVAVTMEPREQAVPALRLAEVGDEDPASSLQHPSNLRCTLSTCVSRQMMKHQRAEHAIEVAIGEWQLLGSRELKRHVRLGPRRFARRSRDHLRRRVDTSHATRRADVRRRRDRQRPGAAADVQHRLTAPDVGTLEETLAKGAFAAQSQQPREEVVPRGPMDDQPMRREHGPSVDLTLTERKNIEACRVR